jgi:betaine-aldehyde dehydrogenase
LRLLSGIGRELGTFGLMNYLEPKQITTYNDADGFGFGWFVKNK